MQNEKSFHISSWHAWAPGMDTINDWIDWSKSPQNITGEQQVQTSHIPPMIKRRCSHLTKMAIHVSTETLKDKKINYAVFCSQHGELNRSVGLLKNIAENEGLSPMNFAQSVHNTSSGLFSIIQKLTQNMNAIAAGKNTFCIGMLDALVWLDLNPNDKVLITIYDDYMPEPYLCYSPSNNHRFALSFVLEKSNKKNKNHMGANIFWEIQPQKDQASYENKYNIPNALTFLSWYLDQNQSNLEQRFSQQTINWYKKR